MAWHKTPNRMADPAYLALPALARAALAALDELCKDGPIVGSKARICLMVGIDAKNGKHGIDPLINAGFIWVKETNGQMVVSLPLDHPSGSRQTTASYASDPMADPRQTPGQVSARPPVSDGEELAIDAGYSDSSLNKTLTDVRESKKKNPPLPPKGFDEFYASYPKKKNRGDAEKAWKAIKPDEELLGLILASLDKAKCSHDWVKDGGQYVPYPATWLRAKGWEDEFHPPLVRATAGGQPDQAPAISAHDRWLIVAQYPETHTADQAQAAGKALAAERPELAARITAFIAEKYPETING